MPDDFSQALTKLKGVGPSLAEKFSRLQINNCIDLLFHLPHRYEDRTRITPIAHLMPHQPAVIQGKVLSCEVAIGRKRSLLCRIKDDSGFIGLRFYYFTSAQKNQLTAGKDIRCFGEVRQGSSGLEIYHPEYDLGETNIKALPKTLTPIYPATEGLSQQRIKKTVNQVLEQLKQNAALVLPDYLPPDLCKKYKLPSLKSALLYLHEPPPDAKLDQIAEKQHPCQQRLAFEELISHSLGLLNLRQQIRTLPAPPLLAQALPKKPTLIEIFLQQLEFKLTDAQQRVWKEIAHDLSQPLPMLRLVQGDVGSGKTVIAALAALRAIENGYQAAIMAPTELLAEQHLITFSHWFEPLNIQLGWLSGKTKGKARQQSLEYLADGSTQLLIGTHALFQGDVAFSKLGIIIIDEQHRFGVHQRLELKQKSASSSTALSCHQLVMTATPIPRSLAMCAYGELDNSIIDELPPGRMPVKTVVLPDSRRNDVIERIRLACDERKQIYWVCTLIEESEQLQCKAAEISAEELKKAIPKACIALIHGRLKSQEKADIMARFKAGDIDLLVATTVIEVGVNVPNASLMVIENPERLGLAQLHQLRGRVGRGAIESFCLLLYHPPLSAHGKARLKIMRESNDGFVVAEKDLALRGPGELLGTRQTGDITFRIADLQCHSNLIEQAQESANTLHTQADIQTINALIKRWLPQGEQYAQV